jgi:hypothetical protein
MYSSLTTTQEKESDTPSKSDRRDRRSFYVTGRALAWYRQGQGSSCVPRWEYYKFSRPVARLYLVLGDWPIRRK